MGFNDQSERRRAENEVVFREHNERIYRQVDHLLPHGNKQTFPVGFLCECSNEACRVPIELPLGEFERYNVHRQRFLVAPEHQQGDIERVIERHKTFYLVEKYEEPPTTNGKLNRTTS